MLINIKKMFSKSRWAQERRTPSRLITRVIMDSWYSLPFHNHIGHNTSVNNESRPFLVWDWSSNPITYDFVWYLFQTWSEFKSRGHEKFNVIIFTPERQVSDSPYHEFVSQTSQASRIENLIIPIAENFEAVKSVSRIYSFSDLEKVIVYNKGFITPKFFSQIYRPAIANYKRVFKYLSSYETADPRLPHFSVSNRSSKGSKYITLTLRDYGWSPERNTTQYDVEMAYEFARYLKASLVIIPDDLFRLQAYDFPESCIFSHEAYGSFEKRVALYSSSLLNLFTPSGPFAASLFTKGTKSICLDFGSSGWDSSTKYYKKLFGIEPGSQPFLPLSGYVLWTRIKGNYLLRDLKEAFHTLSA